MKTVTQQMHRQCLRNSTDRRDMAFRHSFAK